MSREGAHKPKREKPHVFYSIRYEHLEGFTRLVKLFGLEMELTSGTRGDSIQGYRISGPAYNLVYFRSICV